MFSCDATPEDEFLVKKIEKRAKIFEKMANAENFHSYHLPPPVKSSIKTALCD